MGHREELCVGGEGSDAARIGRDGTLQQRLGAVDVPLFGPQKVRVVYEGVGVVWVTLGRALVELVGGVYAFAQGRISRSGSRTPTRFWAAATVLSSSLFAPP